MRKGILYKEKNRTFIPHCHSQITVRRPSISYCLLIQQLRNQSNAPLLSRTSFQINTVHTYHRDRSWSTDQASTKAVKDLRSQSHSPKKLCFYKKGARVATPGFTYTVHSVPLDPKYASIYSHKSSIHPIQSLDRWQLRAENQSQSQSQPPSHPQRSSTTNYLRIL